MPSSQRFHVPAVLVRVALVWLALLLALSCNSPTFEGLDSSFGSASCDNGSWDGEETDLDCGGRSCPRCPNGKYCEFDTDCLGGSCSEGLCRESRCANGEREANESDVDCGGDCPPCEFGRSCESHGDCVTKACIAGRCQLPTCGDDIRNQDESDIDCGGSSGCAPCSSGRSCETSGDCESNLCASEVCAEATCEDNALNQDESDVDCGGVCGGCEDGSVCLQPVDCISGVCAESQCVGSACEDGVKNGAETDVDCGGGSQSGCDVCAIGAFCMEGSDCSNGVCTSNRCQAAECVDGALNGDETDVDCGGSCVGCVDGAGCKVETDCESGVCTSDVCQEPTCSDEVMNQDETDMDCGGSCEGCPPSARCMAGSDCQSLVCDNALCAPPTCSDDKLNGDESDIDCGGSCPSCTAGQACAVHGHCETGYCGDGRCAYTTSCADLYERAASSASGIYRVNPSGESPFAVYCDMTSGGGGWTRVAFEPVGAGGLMQTGQLGLLAAEVGDADAVAEGSAAGNIGPRFNGLYDQLRITWGDNEARMTVAENIFANSVRTNITLSDVTTNDNGLDSAIAAGGGAVFCRAHTSVARPGDTSWAVKPVTSTDNTCGCSGMNWSGQGLFYGGAIPSDNCEAWGGGFAGFCAEGAQKAAVVSTTALGLWVR